MGTAAITVVVTAALLTGFFASFNSGTSPRTGSEFDPRFAAGVSFALLGAMSYYSVVLLADTARTPTEPQSNKFMRLFDSEKYSATLLTGVITGLGLSLPVLLWRAMSTVPGDPGTVWGDFLNSPIPVITLFFATCASTHLGLGIVGLCMAGRGGKETIVWWIMLYALLFIVLLAAFFFLPMANTFAALGASAVLVGASPFVLRTGHAKAREREAVLRELELRAPLTSPTPPRPSPTPSLPPDDLADQPGIHRPDRLDFRSPPDDSSGRPPPPAAVALLPGESMLLSISSTHPSPLHQILLTSHRILFVQVRSGVPAQILDVASPAGLQGAYPMEDGRPLGIPFCATTNSVTVVVALRDRPDIVLSPVDGAAAQKFSYAVNVLARTGRLPD